MAIHCILYAKHLAKIFQLEWKLGITIAWSIMNNQDVIIYNYVGVRKILVNHQSGQHTQLLYWIRVLFKYNFAQQWSSCKKWICTHTKKLVQYAFYRNFCQFGCTDSGGWISEDRNLSCSSFLSKVNQAFRDISELRHEIFLKKTSFWT